MRTTRLKPGVHVGDARALLTLGLPSPNCIITSPPYFDMYDYGSEGQIGFGQSEAAYLDSIKKVLSDLHAISTADAVLWLIVGSIRRRGRLIDLPGRFINLAEGAGWRLREDITWNKAKSLPWAKHGEFRDVTERVLLLTKTTSYQFDVDALRSPEPNSVWWQRYPERYSPAGARPTNVWDIPIRTQGSWGGGPVHFCPFPPELAYRMLNLTTGDGDIVLDPFAGTGIVPAMADAMGRVGYGVELSNTYAAMESESRAIAGSFLTSLNVTEERREQFRSVITQLRTLKFARILGQQLVTNGVAVDWVLARRSQRRATRQYSEFAADFVIGSRARTNLILTEAERVATRIPLSKFGIDPKFIVQHGEPPTGLKWWPDGRFWLTPTSVRPPARGPHVAARFIPNTTSVDDTPYA